ncbi:hypothetical protein E2C01_005660 [Portunus trituberculatus]|uniref:Uncharacterized protein n=1 Tax=Portunus trituberculatus TaxID=210409 RepID=A0A5B7CZR0_PORTR|nr:hypothetical protein [Portunus trituberculatus]
MALTITPELMDQYRTEVQSEPSSCLAMNACFKSDPLEMCMCRCKVMATSHVFTHKSSNTTEVKSMADTKGTHFTNGMERRARR